MEKVYEEAFTEVDEILKLMPIDLISKIPSQFRQAISENKSANYIADIKEPIEEQKLKEETVIILGLIYRDFLASPEERERLKSEDEEELKKIEKEIQEQYNIDNAFKKRKNKKDNQNDTTDIIVYKKPNFFRKIIDLIRGIFSNDKF